MRLLGWIREGDKAACGGTVAEGNPATISHGRAVSYQGARMICRKKCVIAEGVMGGWVDNGRRNVHHGMLTSGGCPLQSTLNDVSGYRNDGGAAIPLSFAQDQNGQWVGDTFEEQTGKRFLVKDSESGEVLSNRKFIAMVDGVKQEGTTDSKGYAHVDAHDGASIDLHLVFEAPIRPLTQGGS